MYLGLRWNYEEDCFLLSVKIELSPSKTKRRQLLWVVSSIFDPLGFLSVVNFNSQILAASCLAKLVWLG